MASQQAIAAVQMNLPSWAASLPANPWTEQTINCVLDQFSRNLSDDVWADPGYGVPLVGWQVVWRTVRQFWVQRVSDTQPLTDVRDSNANRPLSQDHLHALEMLRYWDNYIETSHTTRTGKIRRRYRKRRGVLVGVDPFGFGGPYVRTD